MTWPTITLKTIDGKEITRFIDNIPESPLDPKQIEVLTHFFNPIPAESTQVGEVIELKDRLRTHVVFREER